MSDESRLNPELKKLETELGRLAIPTASIDRDETMYRSGWAAATASFQNDARVAESFSRSNRQSWVWPATAMLTTAASIMLAVLLVIQSASAPGLTGNQQVAVGEDLQPEQDNAYPNQATGRTEVKEPNGNQEIGEPDMVRRVLDFPEGRILTSGLAFQAPDLAAAQVVSTVRRTESSSVMESPISRRQLMEELLPKRQQAKPAWPSLFF
jgi:hypothetical protein